MVVRVAGHMTVPSAIFRVPTPSNTVLVGGRRSFFDRFIVKIPTKRASMDEKRGSSRSKRHSKAPDEGYWDCSVCTYRNSPEAYKCEMCDVRKGTSTRSLGQVLQAQKTIWERQASPKLMTTVHARHSPALSYSPPSPHINQSLFSSALKEVDHVKRKENPEVKKTAAPKDRPRKSSLPPSNEKQAESTDSSNDKDPTIIKKRKSHLAPSSAKLYEWTDSPDDDCPSLSPKPRLNTHVAQQNSQQFAPPPKKEKSNIKKEKNNSNSTKKANRPPRLKNVDRSSATHMSVTVGSVTVVITDFQPKKDRRSSTDTQNVSPSDSSDASSSTAGNDFHEDSSVDNN